VHTYLLSQQLTYEEDFSGWQFSKKGKILVFRRLWFVRGGDPYVLDEWETKEIEQAVTEN
jgi:hypothetical protein